MPAQKVSIGLHTVTVVADDGLVSHRLTLEVEVLANPDIAQAMADSVLAHILKQRKAPLLVVEFPVFYEHFDLGVGDTIDIDNPLYDSRKFYIEEVRREGRFKALVTAEEWWS